MRRNETKKDWRYDAQQKAINAACAALDLVPYRPNYHFDKNTVLVYTKEDAAYNMELDKLDYVYSEQFRNPVWTFENTDANGQYSMEFANFGFIDLRHFNFEEVLTGELEGALAVRLCEKYVSDIGGIQNVGDGDSIFNRYVNQTVSAYSKAKAGSFLGSLRGGPLKRFSTDCDASEFDFCVPTCDPTLTKLLLMVQRGEDAMSNVKRAETRVKELHGIFLNWA